MYVIILFILELSFLLYIFFLCFYYNSPRWWKSSRLTWTGRWSITGFGICSRSGWLIMVWFYRLFFPLSLFPWYILHILTSGILHWAQFTLVLCMHILLFDFDLLLYFSLFIFDFLYQVIFFFVYIAISFDFRFFNILELRTVLVNIFQRYTHIL